MFERIQKWQEQNRQQSEIDALPESDLHDIGVGRSGVRSLIGAGQVVSDRQMAMADRHGLTEHDLSRHPQDLIASIEACAHCGNTGECARYLASDAPASAAAGFCPNHGLYRDLAQD